MTDVLQVGDQGRQPGLEQPFSEYLRRGRCRYGRMTLPVAEFMRRFLLHVLPRGFHRIRYYGLLANAARVENLARRAGYT